MTTLNPRITITLHPQVHAVLRRLSELTKNSQSSLVGELLAESLPIFERMVAVLDAAEKLRAKGMSVSHEVTSALVTAHNRLENQLGFSLDVMDIGNRPLLDAAEKVQRRGAATREKGRSPSRGTAPRSVPTPLSNRGVRSATPTSKKTNKTHSPKGGV